MLYLVALVGVALAATKTPLAVSCGFALCSLVAVHYMILRAAPSFMRVGLKGTDILKKDRPVRAETMGAVVGVVYLFSLLLFIPFLFYQFLVTKTQGGGTRESSEMQTASSEYMFPHSKLSEYLSALLSVLGMVALGFADDLFDLRWRHKFFLPAIAAIPMLIVYYVDFGNTLVVTPPFLCHWLPAIVDLGYFYYAYMAAMVIFCTNCINIYAGVNGLEVGQSVVLGLCVLANDLLYIFCLDAHNPAVESHLLSVYVLVPFLGGSLALLHHNWFPARVFVGDTYCYLAGMVFGVVGVLGHFSKTMLCFFGPQLFNFCYSMPQLFHLVPCPRHRMPLLDTETGLLVPSYADASKASKPVKALCRLLGGLGLVDVRESEKFEVSNLTLINLVLVRVGPLREDKLTTILLGIQLAWGIVAIAARHMLAALVFGRDNWP